MACVTAFALFGSSGNPVADAVARAATISSGAPGYRMSMSISVSSPALTSPLTVTGNGIIDVRDHAAELSMTGNLSQLPQVAQQLGGSALHLDLIMSGTRMYMKLPQAITAAAPSLGGKPWLGVDLSKLSGGSFSSSLWGNPTMSDPTHMLDYLRGLADGVANQGQQQVDGVPTTHYRAALDPGRLVAALPAADRAAMQQASSALTQATHGQSLPLDVWIDAQHLVRRIVMSVTVPGTSGPGLQEAVSADFRDYGPQPAPPVPPGDQVQDLASLAGNASGLFGG